MPWWFYVLATVWSVPVLLVAVGVAMIWRDGRREARQMATAESRAERLIVTDEYRARPGSGFPDLGQSGNPRARP